MELIVRELRRAWQAQGAPSMRKLSERAGISHAAIHNLLTGRNTWSAWTTLEPVGRTLGADMDLLWREWAKLESSAVERRVRVMQLPKFQASTRVVVRAVGMPDPPTLVWPVDWPPPSKDDTVYGPDRQALRVRDVSWYTTGSGPEGRPFVYVVVGP